MTAGHLTVRVDTTQCTCGHDRAFHGMRHLHAPFTEICKQRCCVVDACMCIHFRKERRTTEG